MKPSKPLAAPMIGDLDLQVLLAAGGHVTHAAGLAEDQGASGEEDVRTGIKVEQDGEDLVVTAVVTALVDTTRAAVLTIPLLHGYGVALFEKGVVQHLAGAGRACWATSSSPLLAAFTMSHSDGSAVVTGVDGPLRAVCEWSAEASPTTTTLHVVVAGEIREQEGTTEGPWDGSAVAPVALQAGNARTVRVRLAPSSDGAPRLHENAVSLPDSDDARAHQLALWGSQIGALGTLDIPGSVYPTISDPHRTYGDRHTFFDPDAWSVVAALSYSGVEYLEHQARSIVELAVSAITPEGLAPHHFEMTTPEYVAISGSPQPGPNLFLLEAAIDVAGATGDLAWLERMWSTGLRASTRWVLDRFDPERQLLCVVGALWVDVFRRGGYTLDTNAMAVRTLARAAELAEVVGDPMRDELRATSDAIRHGLAGLWLGDHFVTSRGERWTEVDDHVDSENYLAIATGAATPEQAARIIELFDASPLTHPGDRGTWVSLRRYETEDCYLGNTGDSDTAMARLWWADMLARRALGDRQAFWRHFAPVRADLLERVWLTERYSASGELIRATGYHEYPGLTDYLIREAVYGLSIDPISVTVAPMREGSFAARWGRIVLRYAAGEVYLELADDRDRTVLVRGLTPRAAYVVDGNVIRVDANGTLETGMRGGTFHAVAADAD